MKKIFTLILMLFICQFIKAQVTANAGLDKFGCIKDTLKVIGAGLNANDIGSYKWRNIKTNTIVSNTKFLTFTLNSADTILFELYVSKTTNGNTYTDLDTFKYIIYSLPIFTFTVIHPRCYNDGEINLTTRKTAIVSPTGFEPSVSPSSIRYYHHKKPSWITGGPINTNDFIYQYPKFISNASVPKLGLRDTICYEYTNNKGCYSKECKPIIIYPIPIVKFEDLEHCKSNGSINLNKLATLPLVKSGGVSTFKCIEVPDGSGIDPNTIIAENFGSTPSIVELDPSMASGIYKVEYCFKDAVTACKTCDTNTINVIDIPKLEFYNLKLKCSNDKPFVLDSLVRIKASKQKLTNTQWQCVEYNGSRDRSISKNKNAMDSCIINNVFYPKYHTGTFIVKVEDANTAACATSDSTGIIVNEIPLIMIAYNGSVCSNKGNEILKTKYGSSDTNGYWIADKTSKQGIYNTDSIDFGNSYKITRKIKYIYKNPFTTCSNADSGIVTIYKKPTFKIFALPVWSSKYKVNYDVENLNLDTNLLVFNWNFGNGKLGKYKQATNINYTDSGKYQIVLSVRYKNGNCSTIDSTTINLNSKINSIEQLKLLAKIYPNPVKNLLTVNTNEDSYIKIYDLNGRLLFSSTILSNTETDIDFSTFNSGVYSVLIFNQNNSYWQKMIKE